MRKSNSFPTTERARDAYSGMMAAQEQEPEQEPEEADRDRAQFREAVEAALDAQELTMSTFWYSAEIERMLLSVCDEVMPPVLSYCSSKHSAHIRLDTLLQLLKSQLCFPILNVLIGVGSRGSQLSECRHTLLEALQFYRDAEVALYRSTSSRGSGGSSSGDKEKRHTHTSDESTDGARVELAILLVDGRRSSIMSLDITLEENYALIIEGLVSHLLCVRALSDDIVEAIAANLQSLKEMLVVRSAPPLPSLPYSAERGSWKGCVRSAAGHLFSWLRENQRGMKRNCRNSEIVQSVNPSVRAWLREEEYSSPRDIIRSYHQKYARYLQDMRIPLHSFTHRDLEQAVKDLEREVTQLNHRTYIGGDIVQAVTSEVAKIITYHFNLSDVGALKTKVNAGNVSGMLRGRSRSSSFNSRRDRYSGSDGSVSCMGSDTYELLVSTVLVAASRTIASGDAFFIVQDLFGGDGLVLRPSCCRGPHRESHKESHKESHRESHTESRSHSSGGSVANTVSINITAEDIVVEVEEGFDLFLEEAAGECGEGEADAGVGASSVVPLVSFHSCTRTRLLLPDATVTSRTGSSGSGSGSGSSVDGGCGSGSNSGNSSAGSGSGGSAKLPASHAPIPTLSFTGRSSSLDRGTGSSLSSPLALAGLLMDTTTGSASADTESAAAAVTVTGTGIGEEGGSDAMALPPGFEMYKLLHSESEKICRKSVSIEPYLYLSS